MQVRRRAKERRHRSFDCGGAGRQSNQGRGVLQERVLFSRNPGRTPCRRGTAFRTPAGGKRGFFRSRADGSSVSPLPEGSSPAHGPCTGCGLSLPVGRRGVKLMLRLSLSPTHNSHSLLRRRARRRRSSCLSSRMGDSVPSFFPTRLFPVCRRLSSLKEIPRSAFGAERGMMRSWGREGLKRPSSTCSCCCRRTDAGLCRTSSPCSSRCGSWT